MASSDRSRAEYQKRVNRVIDYIEAHRAEALSLETLAAVAAFSPFHFHRVFKSMTGENLREFIQRTRLENAASHLTQRPRADILEIALENGFSSASAFARAFKERFGMSASAWRNGGAAEACKARQAESKPGEVVRKPGKAAARAADQDGSSSGADARKDEEMTMNVTVKTLPSYRVAYIRNVGPYGEEGGVRDTWQRLARWAAARDLWTADRLCLGIAHDNPKVTEPARCRHDAAIVIPDGLKADGDVNVTDVAGGKYAAGVFVGGGSEIGAAWDHLFARWLPESGYQPDHRPCFELYRGEFHDPRTNTFRCEVCLPVRPL
ncbi:AraC family transcriptional regulator [Sorangium cellulosum]|uniref:AraC family transcriptional regulator n=1 Tax=Sorangium cellulosum TaxID=56 RepID=A0A150QSJ9_SORCE|nr:AraC family transcriptional regulator [Sorangium cellulosum]KYF70949.1 AraC family transcriptional regulator [Sorangium cellulosum]